LQLRKAVIVVVECSELHIDIPAAALNADNNGSIDLTNNPRISDKSKHIDISYQHVRDRIETGKINLPARITLLMVIQSRYHGLNFSIYEKKC